MGLKEILIKIPVRSRRWVIAGATLLLLGGISYGLILLYGSGDARKEKSVSFRKAPKLSPGDLDRDAWIAAQEKNIKLLEQQGKQAVKQMQQLQNEIQRIKKGRDEPIAKKDPVTDKKIKELERKINELDAKTLLDKKMIEEEEEAKQSKKPRPSDALPRELQNPRGKQSLTSSDRLKVFEPKPSTGKKPKATDKDKKKKDEYFLPAGSFMPAVMLNGIDAPTGNGAQGEPYPVLLSVTDLTVLPNRYKANLRECFIIGAGYGNLSDERAYIRTETLSCVRTDGKIVESSIKGHIIGEDGKLGIFGRLVSKQGQQIAMAILAGTLSGIGNALKPNQAYSIYELQSNSTNANDYRFKTPTMNPKVQDVGEAAAMGGVGKALEMVAAYYLKMAEKLYPIIEVDAGRKVEVILLKGQDLTIQGE